MIPKERLYEGIVGIMSIEDNIALSNGDKIANGLYISAKKVEEQAKEYGHSFEREFAYMIVHGFYHLMGYDHIKEEDKVKMRPKEENVLNKLGIRREEMNEG